MAFNWASLIPTVLGMVAGKGPKTKSIGNKYYDQAFMKGLKLYDETDFEALDKASMDQYKIGAEKEALGLMSEYDARMAGAGSPVAKVDTNKDLARASIAGNTSRDVAMKTAELMLSRPSRKRALLPGLDQPSSLGLLQKPGNIDSLMQIGGAIPWDQIFKRNSGGGNSEGSSGGGQGRVGRY